MAEILNHLEVVRLLEEEGALLLEVLPEPEYREEHLPGALSYPLKQLDSQAVEGLSRDRPVVVYCNDFQ